MNILRLFFVVALVAGLRACPPEKGDDEACNQKNGPGCDIRFS